MKFLNILLGAIITLFAQTAYAFWIFSPTYDITPSKAMQISKSDLHGHTENLDPQVLQYGLKAYSCARKRGLDQKQMLTIIDYSKPAVVPRMFVIDLKHLQVKYAQLVAHGEKSGDMVGDHFSNSPESHASSLGVFLTANAYNGSKGPALRLKGLEPGINDNAMSRGIVIHGAQYVSQNRVNREGRLGRSWGCPAVSKNMAQPTINTIKEGTLVFAYAPQSSWLRKSEFLHC